MPQTWLTKVEAAEQAKVSVRTIERAIARGTLRAEKPSRRLVRIRRSDLVAWLAGGFVLLVLLFTLLVIACRLGLESARDVYGIGNAWASGLRGAPSPAAAGPAVRDAGGVGSALVGGPPASTYAKDRKTEGSQTSVRVAPLLCLSRRKR